jgi:hypothetical protein
MRELNDGVLPEHIELISIPFLADDDSVPRLFGLTTNVHGEDVTRFTGEVEYLGGKPGALTWAIEEAAKNTWGSLRCVLGKLTPPKNFERNALTSLPRRHSRVDA